MTSSTSATSRYSKSAAVMRIVFKPLIDHLGLLMLISTDLDALERTGGASVQRAKGTLTRKQRNAEELGAGYRGCRCCGQDAACRRIFRQKNRRRLTSIDLLLVPRAGIEPARCLQRGILSPVRLPIPPSRRHTADIMSDFAHASNLQRCAIALAWRFDKRIIAIFYSLLRACAHQE